jgi:hypothetical protein
MNHPSDPVQPVAASPPSGSPGDDRRQPDRRDAPTSIRGALPPAGRRMRARRAEEHRRQYFVDRFPAATLAAILVVCLATLLDGVLTIHLVGTGCEETNPAMRPLLAQGVAPFLIVKYLLTVAGLPLLLIFKNFYLFGTRLRVGHLLPIFVGLYLILLAHQMRLMGMLF